MEILIKITLIASLSVWFAEVVFPPRFFAKKWGELGSFLFDKKLYKTPEELREGKLDWAPERFKPFDCALCLAWWSGLIYFGLTSVWYMSPVYAACASLLAVWISKQIRP